MVFTVSEQSGETVKQNQVEDEVDVILAQWACECPDLDTSPMAIIARISRIAPLLNEKLSDVFTCTGLDFPTFDVLATLRRSGPPYELTPGQLASSMTITPGATAQRLAKLEQQGLVTRTHNNTDRRKVTVGLTPAGLARIEDAIDKHANAEHSSLSIFTREERATLVSLLRRLLLSFEGSKSE